jgi:uncharacterized OB-fold protein
MFANSSFHFDVPSHWVGDLPVTSRYTAGIALEKFLIALKEEGTFYGARCPACSKTYVPLTLFCPICLAELHDLVDVGLQGEIHTYTILYKNLDGSLMEHPQIIAFIKIADGGIIHRVDGIAPDQITIGTLVAADLKPKEERTGSILDIRAFKPLVLE